MLLSHIRISSGRLSLVTLVLAMGCATGEAPSDATYTYDAGDAAGAGGTAGTGGTGTGGTAGTGGTGTGGTAGSSGTAGSAGTAGSGGIAGQGGGTTETCSDGIQNQGETGVDCGGPCDACVSCSDGIQNQSEEGVDCGGPCPPCGGTCDDNIQNNGETGVDCGGPCPACPATCDDGIQNQGETGVDCGGPCTACPSCGDGIQNQGETGVDCGGPCAACATCSDGIQNQGETGVDCGGPCAACPSCSDGIQNQGETGVDCGGPCAACATCSDGIQNQGETGVDCGGPCSACVVGFTHQENFNSFPTWGPDGQYQVSGVCNGNASVDGWGLTNYVLSSFPQGTGFYAIIDTDDISYIGITCNDYMITPMLAATGASSLTIQFDTQLDVYSSTTAEVIVELNGVQQTVWTRTSDLAGQHVSIGPINIAGTSALRVLWHYVGSYEFHWAIDNIVVVGS